jgi:hypothetical protein
MTEFDGFMRNFIKRVMTTPASVAFEIIPGRVRQRTEQLREQLCGKYSFKRRTPRDMDVAIPSRVLGEK